MTDSKHGLKCASLWGELYLDPDGSMRTCCVAPWDDPVGNLKEQDWTDIWNNDRMREIRQYMLEGKRHPNCEVCYKAEDEGRYSFRHYINEKIADQLGDTFYNPREDGYDFDYKLGFLDVRWSNVCNFSCRMCGSALSSKWAEIAGEQDKIINFPAKNIDVDTLPLENIREIYLAGGEPFLTPETFKLINRMVDEGRTDVDLMINTNLSVFKYKNQSVLDLLPHFNFVKLLVSLDAYGERGEYIRSGQDWNRIEKNIRKIQDTIGETENFQMRITATHSMLNAQHLIDFLEYMANNFWYFEKHRPGFQDTILNTLSDPEEFQYIYLPPNMAQMTADAYEKYRDENCEPTACLYNFFTSAINKLRNQPDYETIRKKQQKFIKRVNAQDKIFGTDCRSTFPELKPIWESAGVKNE